MNKTMKILAGLLGAQLLLALGLGLGGRDFAAAPETALLEIDPATVDQLVIENAAGERLDLVKEDAGWLIPDLGNAPAAAHKVRQPLDALAGLRPRHPVSTSDAGAERFKVADDGFERHIRLEAAGDTVADLYLGESAGFRRSYVRKVDDSAVYELEIAAFDFSADSQQWVDKTLLNLDPEQVQAFGIGDWTLERSDSGWTLRGDERAVDSDKVEALLGKISRLSYLSLEPTDGEPETAALATVHLQMKDEGTTELSLFEGADGERYTAISARHPWRFILSAGQGKPITEADLSSLLAAAPETPAATQDTDPVAD